MPTQPGGGPKPGKPPPSSAPPPGAVKPAETAHQLFMTFAGETIGVLIIAVFADLNDDLGRVLMVIMIGWFLLFLMINATTLSGLVQKV